MLIKVITNIVLEVKDEEEADEACIALGSLERVLANSGFPHGEIVDTDVDHYEKVSNQEAEEMGWVE